MTSHIESMANQSEERKSQLRSIFARMTGAGTDTVSIFGGDTNAKDREVRSHAEASVWGVGWFDASPTQ